MRKNTRWFMFLVCMLLGMLRADAVVLGYNLKKGDTIRYREMSSQVMKITTDMGAGKMPVSNLQISLNAVMRDTVTDVTPKGIIIIVRAVESGTITTTMTMNGKPQKSTMPYPKMRTTIKMTADGTVLSVHSAPLGQESGSGGPNVPGSPDMMSQLMQTAALDATLSRPPLPKNDLKPNEAWSGIISVPGLFGGTAENLTLNSRLLAVEPYKGTDCAKIRTSFSIPIDSDLSEMLGGSTLPQGFTGRFSLQGKIAGTKLWQFDYKKGRELYAEGTLGMTATTSFQMIDPKGKQIKGDYKMNMKANTKSVLLEGK